MAYIRITEHVGIYPSVATFDLDISPEPTITVSYDDAQAMLAALAVVVNSQQYRDYMGARLNAAKQGTP